MRIYNDIQIYTVCIYIYRKKKIWACWSQLPRVALDNWRFIQRTNAMEICIFGRPLEESKNVDWHCAGLVFFKNFKDGFPQFPQDQEISRRYGVNAELTWDKRHIPRNTEVAPGVKGRRAIPQCKRWLLSQLAFRSQAANYIHILPVPPRSGGPIWSKIIKVNPWVLKTPIGWGTIGKFKAPKSSKICLCCSYATCGTQKSGWCCSASIAWVGPLCCSFTMCQSRQSTNDHKFHAAIQHSF